jgi:hypothetical protein
MDGCSQTATATNKAATSQPIRGIFAGIGWLASKVNARNIGGT